ncbi:MAG: ABC transporter permease, partial [Cytophagaceae bacterium]
MSISNNPLPAAEQTDPISNPASTHVTIIRATRGLSAINFLELWQYRDLLLTLGLRDVQLRYRQTALGVIWVVLQPLLTSVIFTVVFGLIAKMPTNTVPQFLLSYVGMLAWSVFSGILTRISISMIGNAQLVSKIYFPRLILPLSTSFSVLVDFGVAALVLIPLMFVYHVHIGVGILLAPLFLLLILLISLGVGLYAAALTVNYRDVQYIVPFVLQLLLYASPVH